MDLDWRTTLLLLTGVPSLIAAVWAWFQSREIKAARFFVGLIVAWVLLSTPYIIGFSGAYQAWPWLTFFPFNTELWLGPLWLLLVISLTQQELPEHWRFWLVPGLVQTSYYSICFLTLGDGPSKFAFNDSFHEPFIVPVETLVSLGLIIYASYDSARRLTVYRRQIAREHGNRDRVELDWLGRAWFAILIMAGIWIATDLLQAALGQWSYPTNFYVYLTIGVIFLVLSFDFLSRVDRVYPKFGKHDETEGASPKAQNEEKIDLGMLRETVKGANWHLDPELTLTDLARHLATNKSTLSAWLNSDEEGNFSTFINGLRVEAVCDRLRSSSEKPNLLLVAFQCGFGSKATFNRAFKKHTGQSPRDWLQALDADVAA